MDSLFAAALTVGADGVFFTGGGSAVAALARGIYDVIGEVMLIEGRKSGVSGQVKVVDLSKAGALNIKEN